MSDKDELPELASTAGRLQQKQTTLPAERAQAQPFTAPPSASEFARFLAALYRHKWLVVLAVILGLGAGLGASRFFHPEYVAQGKVWIEGSSREGDNQGPIRAMELLKSYAWVELLKSYTVLDYVVKEQRLFIEAGEFQAFDSFELSDRFRPGDYRLTISRDGKNFTLLTAEGQEIQKGAVGDSIGKPVGFSWLPAAWVVKPGRILDFTVNNPRDVARQLADKLDATMVDDGRFLSLSLSGRNPERLAATMNSMMKRYVEVAAQLKRAKLDELTKILEEQRNYAERNLRDSEMSLEAFRVQTITLPTSESNPVTPGLQVTRDPVFAHFFQMNVDAEDLRRDDDALTNILTQASAGTLAIDALASVPAAQTDVQLRDLITELTAKRAELRALERRYTSEHPPVKALQTTIANLEKTLIPNAVRELQAQLKAREASLESSINTASVELRQIPPRAIEEARLQRRVEIAATLHGNLRQRYEEARLAAVSSLPDIRILDAATVPSAAVKDLRPLVIAGFAAAALALALLGVLLRDRSDRRVRYPEQITAGMGLPILGAVPHLNGGFASPTRESAAQFAEALRELRLAVLHAYGGAEPLTISLTSPESGDGKSMIAASLAGVFADQGYRVLLIDGDVRRGVLHRTLSARRAPGLTDYLIGDLPMHDVVQPTSAGFWLIGSGTRMHNSPELLGSRAMSHLIRDLSKDYSVIIVDTPPLSAGVDAYVLGTATANMLLVLRTGSTDGVLAEAKLNLLDRLPVRVLGAVLNDVPRTRIYRYYSYASGYETSTELTAPWQIIPASAGDSLS